MVTNPASPTLGRIIKNIAQPRQAPFQIAHHIPISETHSPETELTQHLRITQRVGLSMMRIAVHFDHNTARRAEKIDDAMADHVLTAEFETGKATVTQGCPQALFRFGRVVAHGAGAGFERFG